MANAIRATLALGCSYIILGAVSAAHAQQTEAAATDEIVVTAQFREQRLQDTPLSITAMSAEILEARGQTNLAEIASQAPNVTLKAVGGAFGPSMAASIRGIGQYDFNPALEPGVGIYVDDVYLPTLTGAMLDLMDLQRVEVLRGPQGTLTGRNSIGGAIRLISQQPAGDGTGFVEGSAGSADRMGFRGAADFAITENLFARISGVTKRQDGYVDRIDYGCANPLSGVPATVPAGNCSLGEVGDYSYDAVRGMLRFVPNDRLDITLSADYILDERTSADVLSYANLDNPNTNPAPGVPFDSAFICGEFCNYSALSQPAAIWAGPVAPGFPLVATSSSGLQRFEGRGLSANIQFDITDSLNLTSVTAYREYQSSFSDDGDLSPANIGHGQNALDHEFFSQELRLNGELGEDVQFTLGAYYSDQTTTYFTYQDIRYAPIPLQFIGNDPVEADTQALFGTVIWNPIDPLTVTGGVRYSEDTKEYTFFRLDPTTGGPNAFLGAINGVTGSYEGDQVDYRVSVDYRWSDSLMTYFTYSTGFKGGGISPRPFNPDQVRPFDPETLTAYEIGAKSDLFDDRLRLNASVFFNDYKDIILTLLSCPQFGGPGPCALAANAGDGEMTGVELEFTANLTDAFTIDGSVSTLDFEYSRVDAATGLSLDGTMPFTPELKWSLGAQYVFDLGASGTLTPRVDVSYQDDIFTNAANGPRNHIDAYTIANARLSWRNADDDLSISLEGSNITDEYYLQNRFDLTGAGAGVVADQPGRPREWALVVRKDF